MGIMRRARSRKRAGGDRENGASLVEMAMILPFLILLLLGIIEFGWLFGLSNDVRHGAREGARYAAVDGGDNAAIHQYVCSAMEPLGGPGFDQLDIELTRLDTNGVPGIQIGDSGSIRVAADISSLSGAGLVEIFLPNQVGSTIEFRIEQTPSWTDDGVPVIVTC